MISPAPQIRDFGWIWRKWFETIYEYLNFERTQATITTTSATLGDNLCTFVDDDTAGGIVTLTLPAAAKFTRVLHVKKLGTTANVVVDGDGSETIDGSTTYTMTTQYESLSLVSTGTEWYVI